MNLPTVFGNMLRELRADKSVRQLAKDAHVPHSLIVALENGKRSAGAKTAEKLADGLHLRGNERDSFLTAAQSTTLRNRFGPTETRKTHSERVILDLIMAFTGLERAQIRESIFCEQDNYDIIVLKTDGTVLGIEIKQRTVYVVEAAGVERLPSPDILSKPSVQQVEGAYIREVQLD
jgi:transcriptional regulator with XRE-family HTH domain